MRSGEVEKIAGLYLKLIVSRIDSPKSPVDSYINMRFLIIIIASLILGDHSYAQTPKKEFIVYFETPLGCEAKQSIGCGSRAKPLLQELEASEFASEAWLNREGTYVAIVLKEPYLPLRQLLGKSKRIFDQHEVEFRPVQSTTKQEELREHFREVGKWYRNAAVDSLSLEEAAWMTEGILPYIEGFAKLSNDSASMLRNEFQRAIGNSLINSGDLEQLHRELMAVSTRYIGASATERSVQQYMMAQNAEQPQMYTSTITCPHCGHKKTETMAADKCIMQYTCESCKKVIKHKKGDCCVFCSYGDVKCPTAE